MILTNPKSIKTHYLICLIIGIGIVHFTPKGIREFGVVFFALSTFVLFFINHMLSFYPFRRKLKDLDPKTFHSNSVNYEKFDTTRTSNLMLYSDKEQLEKIKDKDFQKLYQTTKTSLSYAMLSFATIIALAISQIVW